MENKELTYKTKSDIELPWKPFLRQTFICSGIWMCVFLNGVSAGAPTVFIQQIRKEANSTDAVSSEMASWINAASYFASMVWAIVLTIVTSYFGRVLPYRFMSIMVLVGSIIFCFSTNMNHIMISEIMQGVSLAAVFNIFIMILVEYTTPQYRGVFLTIKSSCYYSGIWVSNAIGTFAYWKNIGKLQTVCSVYIVLTALTLPESPYWLASNKKIQECEVSHRLLKGYTEAADKELDSIIKYQNMKTDLKSSGIRYRIIYIFREIVTRKELYKPILLCLLLINLYNFTGKLVCTVYSLDIFLKITSSETAAYTVMLILDGITLVGMFIGCALTKIMQRKSLLLYSTSLGVIFLYIMSLYLYLVRLSIISKNEYVTACFLVFYFIGISCGPMILCLSITSELLPLKFKGIVVFIISIYETMMMGVLMKLAPAIFMAFGAHGAFLFFGILTTVFLTIAHIYLPETKDKSLQEIALLMNDDIKNVTPEQSTALVNDNVNDVSEKLSYNQAGRMHPERQKL